MPYLAKLNISKLEKENFVLKQEISKIKALYEDRLEELNWYYQKYGRKGSNKLEEDTQETGKDTWTHVLDNHHSQSQVSMKDFVQNYEYSSNTRNNGSLDYQKLFNDQMNTLQNKIQEASK